MLDIMKGFCLSDTVAFNYLIRIENENALRCLGADGEEHADARQDAVGLQISMPAEAAGQGRSAAECDKVDEETKQIEDVSLYLGQLFVYAHACKDEFHAFLRQTFASGFCFPNTCRPVPCYVSPSKYNPTDEEIAQTKAPFRVLHVAGREERYIGIDVPVKKLERTKAKIEFDYAEDAPPRSAKVLDLLRGSVIFDDPRGLVAGFHHFRAILENDPYVALGRVKNGHRKWDLGGYVDLKVNFIFVSREDPLHRQICELQFILKPLHVLKESVCHRQYEVIRREPFGDMVVADEEPTIVQMGCSKRGSRLQDMHWKAARKREAIGWLTLGRAA